MSIENNAPKVKIFNLISESIKLLAQNLSRPLVFLFLLSIGGLLAADVLTLILKRIIHFYSLMEIVQWLLKVGIMIATAWATVYLMRLPGAERASLSINDLMLAVKNNLSRILKTFGAVITRFSGLIIVGIISGLIANISRTPEIFLIVLPVISLWSVYLFVGYIFWVYLIFDKDLKPAEITAYSAELAIGHRWKIFFTMIACGILITIASVPMFLLYPSTLESDRSSAVANFAIDFFRDPALFVLLYYILLSLAIVFQTVVFMKFYDRITENKKTQHRVITE